MTSSQRGHPVTAAIDIDGVLADVRHRLHHVERRPKDWDAFFSAAVADPPLAEGLKVAHELAAVCDIVYLSGRPEFCRADTLGWLDRHGLPKGDLWLRPHRDRRPARLVKVELLDRLSESKPVTVLVDDDPLVCEAAREAGYDVLPATWMGRAPTLLEAQEGDGAT
jgi:hypothetical protein